ncbi:MAG: toxin-antitoxin system HicB family antitoxin, partial [Bacteroidales bacterium]|nr:toxin-antitoxin system HicB family antitoxin [Bacteroidales bacterium]
MKKVIDYLDLPYKVEIIKNEDSTFFASIKELPGCMTEGDTIVEAYEMIEEAKSLWIETALSDGSTIPEPEILSKKNYSGKLVLRIPKSLHRRLAKSAEENEVSLN